MTNQFSLFSSIRFCPLFVAMFFGAFNDNLLKTVLAVMIAYGLWDIGAWDPAILIAVASGLFILPFILFCPLAGNLGDKYDKAMLIRRIKLAEIIIVLVGSIALFTNNLYFAFAVLLALGLQSAFFSPYKFSLLPEHLKPNELIAANALISTGTYWAILAGTILGAILALLTWGKVITAIILILAAIIGYVAARMIPQATPPEQDLKINYNIFSKIITVIRAALKQPPGVLTGILCVAWFYFVAATFHAQFPNFTKQTLGADNLVLTVFMIVFSVGVAIGGLLNNRFLKSEARGIYTPIACFFMAIFGIDIYFAAKAYPAPIDDTLHSFSVFMSNIHGIRLMMDTFLQAVACGFFVVPLRAMVQHRAETTTKSRVISSSTMMDALFIFSSAIISTVLLSLGVSIEGLYLAVSVLTLCVAALLFRIPSLRAKAEI